MIFHAHTTMLGPQTQLLERSRNWFDTRSALSWVEGRWQVRAAQRLGALYVSGVELSAFRLIHVVAFAWTWLGASLWHEQTSYFVPFLVRCIVHATSSHPVSRQRSELRVCSKLGPFSFQIKVKIKVLLVRGLLLCTGAHLISHLENIVSLQGC